MRFALAELSSPERYKLLGGLVVPRPIALVTTRDRDGRANAAPFSFFNVVAEEPPLIVLGLGVHARGGAKDTTNNIRDGGEFVVNLVDEPLAAAMNLCAIDLPPEVSEIDLAGLELLPSEAVAPGRIAAAPVSMECKRYITLQPGAERYIVLGEVLVLHVKDGIVDPARLRIDRDAYAPIGRLFGGGYVRTRDRFDMPRISYRDWLARKP
ncbi:MAG: flavin reductase like domain protein [Geminicoccaceae bacterium]|nr:flavin reductase like domain protein [Geminicoccaceae bacterium]